MLLQAPNKALSSAQLSSARDAVEEALRGAKQRRQSRVSCDHNMSRMCCQHRKKEANCQEDNGSLWMDGDGSSCAEKCSEQDTDSARGELVK